MLTAIVFFGAGVYELTGKEVNVLSTNRVETWVTNLIEVRIPVNRFVNQYRTNWVERVRNRVVDVYKTNQVTRFVTNEVPVVQMQTNFVNVYRTNQVSWTLTNSIAVAAVRTNFVNAYQTNWKTLNLTNWATVLVMKTNWVTQQVTNVVKVDLPSPASGSVAVAPKAVVHPTTSPPIAVPAVALTSELTLEAKRTSRPPRNNQVEVQLSVRWTKDRQSAVRVQQWKVQSENRSILFFGQDRDFRRELPAGRYTVEVRARRGGADTLLITRGTLTLTAQEAAIQQKFAAR